MKKELGLKGDILFLAIMGEGISHINIAGKDAGGDVTSSSAFSAQYFL